MEEEECLRNCLAKLGFRARVCVAYGGDRPVIKHFGEKKIKTEIDICFLVQAFANTCQRAVVIKPGPISSCHLQWIQ
jgi:hypothetical protein